MAACLPYRPNCRSSSHVAHAWWCPVASWQSTTWDEGCRTHMPQCQGLVHARVCHFLPPHQGQRGRDVQKFPHGPPLRAFPSASVAFPLFVGEVLQLFCSLVPNLLQSLGGLVGWLLCTAGARQDTADEWQWCWRQTQILLGNSTAYLGHGGRTCPQRNVLGSIQAETEMARFSFGDLSDCCQLTVICACLCPTIIGPRQA